MVPNCLHEFTEVRSVAQAACAAPEHAHVRQAGYSLHAHWTRCLQGANMEAVANVNYVNVKLYVVYIRSR